MNIGVVVVATRKYVSFLAPFLHTLQQHFFTDSAVTVYVFSDVEVPIFPALVVRSFLIPPYGFPEATLFRYRIITEHAHEFVGEGYLFYADVDLAFCGQVSHEILPDGTNDCGIAAVLHAGHLADEGWNDAWEPWDGSTAFVPGEHRQNYYAGGFQGGKREDFLAMAATLARNISTDLEVPYIALWHDESHLNHFLSSRNPKVLSPVYCYPEFPGTAGPPTDGPPKIVALNKDHSEMRS